jgi:hypothetical protein
VACSQGPGSSLRAGVCCRRIGRAGTGAPSKCSLEHAWLSNVVGNWARSICSERAWFDSGRNGGAMNVRVVGDVARVGPLPAVAGGRDRTIAPINFVEATDARSVPSASRVLWLPARHNSSSPSARQPGLNWAMVQMWLPANRCNRRAAAHNAVARHTPPSPQRQSQPDRTNRPGLVQRFLMPRRWVLFDWGDGVRRGIGAAFILFQRTKRD